MNLIKQIKNLQKSVVKNTVTKRLNEFQQLHKKNNAEWFSELCFCILTANSKARTAINIQKELGSKGFLNSNEKLIKQTIVNNKHRFHNNKTRFILEARQNKNIKKIVKSFDTSFQAREWLAKNIKGIGFKEASHFLRNVGYNDVAILDRHILRALHENKLIKIPKTLTKKSYIEIEKIFIQLASKLDMNLAELDLYMWFLKTGKVLK